MAVRTSGGAQRLRLDKTSPLASLGPVDVSLKMLMSPIHKADIQLLEGGDKVSGGLGVEGLAEVVDVGSAVKSLKKGDWVVPPLGFGELSE